MLPHFGYHAVVIMVRALTPADWVAAAEIVTLGGVAACAVVVAWWRGGCGGALRTSASALLVAAALVPVALCVLQPVLPLDPTRYDAWLFGYFQPNQWHSLGLPRFRGQVNAFGHLMTFVSTVVGVGAVGHARSAWSKGLVGARRASTGPAASTPGAAA